VAQLSVGKLKHEEKANLAVNMSNVCVRICVDSVRDQNPTITKEGLIERVTALFLAEFQ